MIFPSRNQLASKQIRRTGRAEAVTKEGLAATLLPRRSARSNGTTSFSTASTSSTAVSCEAKGLAYKFARFWALPSFEVSAGVARAARPRCPALPCHPRPRRVNGARPGRRVRDAGQPRPPAAAYRSDLRRANRGRPDRQAGRQGLVWGLAAHQRPP